jgi:hypothetical protein
MPATATDQSLPRPAPPATPTRPSTETQVASGTIPHDRRLATATCS